MPDDKCFVFLKLVELCNYQLTLLKIEEKNFNIVIEREKVVDGQCKLQTD